MVDTIRVGVLAGASGLSGPKGDRVVTAPWLLVAGCGGGVDVSADPPPSCDRAYDATIASVAAVFVDAGAIPPPPPPRDGWLERCEALALPAEALRCLEPAEALARPDACAAALAPSQPGVDALAAWFADALFADALFPAPAGAHPRP